MFESIYLAGKSQGETNRRTSSIQWFTFQTPSILSWATWKKKFPELNLVLLRGSGILAISAIT